MMMMVMVTRSPARRSSAMRAISETCWSPEDYTKCFLAKSIRRRKVGSEGRKEELPQVDILEVGLFVKVRGSWLLRPLRIGMPETITSSSCIVGTFKEIFIVFYTFFKTLRDKVMGILRRYVPYTLETSSSFRPGFRRTSWWSRRAGGGKYSWMSMNITNTKIHIKVQILLPYLCHKSSRNGQHGHIHNQHYHNLHDHHDNHPYLIFVIFFTRAKFLENIIYTEKTRKLRQNTQ